MKDAEKNKQQLLAEVDRLRQELARLRGAEAGHKRLQEAVIRRAEELDGLNALAVSLGSSLELQHLVDAGIESTVSAFKADAGIVLLFDSTSESFTPAAQVEISDEMLDLVLESDSRDGLLGRAAESGEVLEIPDLEQDPESFPGAADQGFRWCLVIPARGRGVMRAVIVLLAKQTNTLGVEREELPEQVGRLFGMALANAQEYRLSQQEIVERMVVDREQARLSQQVQDRARRLQQIVDTVPIGLLMIGGSGKILHSNRKAIEDLEQLGSDGERLDQINDLPLDELLSRCLEEPWVRVKGTSSELWIAASPLSTSDGIGDEAELWALVLREATVADQQPPAGPPPAVQPAPPAQPPTTQPPTTQPPTTQPPTTQPPAAPPPASSESSQPAMTAVTAAAPSPALGDFAGDLASHLNDLLGVVALHTDLALRRSDIPETVIRWLTIIDQQVDEAGTVFDRVLDYSQRTVMDRRPDDLKVRIENLSRHIKRTLPESIEVKLEIGEGDFLVSIDPMRFEQALMNIALNARDAMPEGGELEFKLDRVSYDNDDQAPLAELVPGDWVRVTISDNGSGITPEALPQLFQPFFTTKGTEASRGLGLPQAQGLIRQHDGHLHLAANQAGTTASVYVPVLETLPPTTATPPPLALGDGQSVLVVEDDQSLRQALLDSLKTLRYRSFEAESAEQARTLMAERADLIKVAVIDTELPDEDPQQLLDQLHELSPELKMVLMLGPANPGQTKLPDRSEISGRLPKPVTLQSLSQALATAFS